MKFRSFKRAYGGDPDSSVLKDLHRRLMRVEIDLARAEAAILLLRDRPQLVMASPVQINAARDKGVIGGSEIPPPPKD